MDQPSLREKELERFLLDATAALLRHRPKISTKEEEKKILNKLLSFVEGKVKEALRCYKPTLTSAGASTSSVEAPKALK